MNEAYETLSGDIIYCPAPEPRECIVCGEKCQSRIVYRDGSPDAVIHFHCIDTLGQVL